jgi:hypothetical protein
MPTSTVKVSTDGTCGNVNSGSSGFICTGSSYGDCCSRKCIPILVLNNTDIIKHMGTAVPQQATAAPAAKILSVHALAPQPQLQELRPSQLQRSTSHSMAPAEAPQDKHVKVVTSETAARSMGTVEAPHCTAQGPANQLSAPALFQ